MADQFSPEAIEILQRGDPGVGHLDKIVKQYDIDYSHAQNSQDMGKADAKMIKAIDCLPGKKTETNGTANGQLTLSQTASKQLF